MIDFSQIVSDGTPQEVQSSISQDMQVDARNKEGETALMIAARTTQHPEVISSLLKAGVDVNAKDAGGRTPLLFAAQYNPNPEVIVTLLEAGADAKAKDAEGKTAFDYVQAKTWLEGTDAYRRLREALLPGV